MQPGIAADGLESPRSDRAPRRLAMPLVPGEDMIEALLVQHVDRDVEAVEQVGRRRRGEEAARIVGDHPLPRPELLGRLGLARERQRLLADRVEAEAGRQHQPLLRAGNADVDAPFVVAIVGAGEPGNGVDQEQSGMARSIDRLVDFVDARGRPRRSLVVHDADRLDRVARILAQPALDPLDIDAAAPIGADEFRPQTQVLRHVFPEGREMSRLIHQNGIARGKQIGERRLPRAGARGRVDEDVAVGLEDALDLGEHTLAQLLKLRPAMIDHGHVHRPQYSLGDRARSRNLQEVTARSPPFVVAHLRSSTMPPLPPLQERAGVRAVGITTALSRLDSPSKETGVFDALWRHLLPRRAGEGTRAGFDLRSPVGTFNARRRKSQMGGSVAALERALREEGVGEIQFDAFARGRYATDASSYQIMPLGVVIPGSIEEAARALRVARSRGVPVLPRGGGTSQSGQTVNAALVVDCSKRLTKILSLDAHARTCKVEPGIVLDELNRRLKPEGLWFPVDISTASRATVGGMAGNNSCGGRSLRYGTMRDNVLSIDAVLADGSAMHFGEISADFSGLNEPAQQKLAAKLLGIGAREADEVARNFPHVQRRVGGYNL